MKFKAYLRALCIKWAEIYKFKQTKCDDLEGKPCTENKYSHVLINGDLGPVFTGAGKMREDEIRLYRYIQVQFRIVGAA